MRLPGLGIAIDGGLARPFQIGRLSPAAKRRLAAFGLLGLGAYAFALIATLPARTALAWAGLAGVSHDAVGTAWNGETAVGAGVTAAWKVSPLRSMVQMALAGDVSVQGADTDLSADAGVRPGRLALGNIKGRAGWAVIDALAPNLPFACDMVLRVDLSKAVIAGRRSGAVGELSSGPGSCRSKTGAAVSLTPALSAFAKTGEEGFSAWAAPSASPSARWAQARLTPQGKLVIDVTSTGAAALPPGVIAGPVTLEIDL